MAGRNWRELTQQLEERRSLVLDPFSEKTKLMKFAQRTSATLSKLTGRSVTAGPLMSGDGDALVVTFTDEPNVRAEVTAGWREAVA